MIAAFNVRRHTIYAVLIAHVAGCGGSQPPIGAGTERWAEVGSEIAAWVL
jgi:hypothetical protein